jgi:hypothetical protein
MGIFFKEAQLIRTFQPPSSPPRPRVLDGGEVNEQKACLFFTKLPSEIRNEIYYLVFGTPTVLEEEGERLEEERTSESEDSAVVGRPRSESIELERELEETGPDIKPARRAHALSPLLTCRKVSQEATVLAFTTYTFTISHHKSSLFFTLRNSTTHLSPKQFGAITNVALSLRSDYSRYKASDFLSNAMLLFPTVRHLTIRVPAGTHTEVQARRPDTFLLPTSPAAIHEAALNRYVPVWLLRTVQKAVNGRSFSWQTGQKWRVEWPQFKSAAYRQETEYFGPGYGWHIAGSMSLDAAGCVPGVQLCACGCNELRWLDVRLVQDTGRTVHVGVVHYRDVEAEDEYEQEIHVRLKPLDQGVKPLPVRWSQGGDAAAWEVDDKYWDRLRARKGS